MTLAWIERSSGSFHKREVSWARVYIYTYEIVKNPEGYMYIVYMMFNGCSAPFSSSLWLVRQLLGWASNVNNALSSCITASLPHPL